MPTFTDLTQEDPSTEALDARTQELLSELSLDEKLTLIDGDNSFYPGLVNMLEGAYSRQTWDAGVTERLGIPGIRFADGPRGVVLTGATTFPVPMARGASWDVELETKIGDAVGRELRALGGNLFGGVCINLLRHPAWGRAQETYGEDSYHLGEFGAALTRGVQRHVMACVKHCALNSIENARFKVDVKVDPRALHEVYLPHFKRVVDEGVAAVMSAYNSVNGEWCGQSETLLRDILKTQWGFEGFVMTDFIFGMRDAKKAMLAGQDLEMPFRFHYHKNLRGLVESGEVPKELLDDAVARLLKQQLRFAQGAAGERYDESIVGCEAHRELAREAAQKSIVLLKNEGNLLPLKDVKKLAVVGRLAATPNTGDGGSSNTSPDHVVTPLEGLQAALTGQAEVAHAEELGQAVALAKEADVALVVVGYTHEDEGEFLGADTMKSMATLFPTPTLREAPMVASLMKGMMGDTGFSPGGDRSSLNLRAEDEALIKAVSAVNKRTIIAVMSGSAVTMNAWQDAVPVILMLWYPGMEGGHALADILLGKVSPGGKLPFVVPEKQDDLPFFDKDAEQISYDLWHGYRKLERENVQPAFPFGFGLSYTTFEYADLQLEPTKLNPSDTLTLQFEISNTGEYDAAEVTQLYVSALDSSVERAPKELKAFTRTFLKAGETTQVQINLPVSRLAYYDEAKAAFVVEGLEYEVFVGRHSLDEAPLKARFTVSKS